MLTVRGSCAIRAWAVEHSLNAIIWTDLEANFEQKLKQRFSVDAAVGYWLVS